MAGTKDIRVLTLNAWGIPYLSSDVEARMVAISEELAKGEFSIVLLQEIWSPRHYALIREHVKEVLPHSHYFYSGYIGSGCATFSAYPIVDTFFHPYSHNGHCWDILHGDWFAGKGVGCAVVQHPECAMYVFNTHLHADYNTQCEDCLEESRVLQNYQLTQFVKQTTRPGDVVILGGDMNSTPDSLGIKAILQLAKLNDTYVLADTKPDSLFTLDQTSNKYVGADEFTSRIDYIFCSSALECTSAKLALQKIPNTDLHFSDHEGYTATLTLRKDAESHNKEYSDSPGVLDLLTQFHISMVKGQELSDRIYWWKVMAALTSFFLLVIFPLLSVVEVPAAGCWLGKVVILLQIIVVVFCTAYFWLLMFIRVTDRRAFRNVAEELQVKIQSLRQSTTNKKMQ